VAHVNAEAPPWLALHGSADTLAPAAEARLFVDELAKASREAVLYCELQGAHHAFDIYYSHRAVAAVEMSARFLATCRARARPPQRVSES
jgi:acetyl esterase/lipase